MPQQSPTAGTRQTPRQCWRGTHSRGRSWLQSRGGGIDVLLRRPFPPHDAHGSGAGTRGSRRASNNSPGSSCGKRWCRIPDSAESSWYEHGRGDGRKYASRRPAWPRGRTPHYSAGWGRRNPHCAAHTQWRWGVVPGCACVCSPPRDHRAWRAEWPRSWAWRERKLASGKLSGKGGWVTSPIIAAVSVRANPSIPMPRKLMRSSRKLSQSPGRNVAKSICANSTRNWSRCAGVDMRCDADGVSCCFMETRIARRVSPVNDFALAQARSSSVT